MLYLQTFGLRCERFTKDERRIKKTPDFRVFRDDTLLMYCEIKTIASNSRLANQLKIEVVPGVAVSGSEQDDSAYNRIASDIHEAIKQFDSVNLDISVPNVLAFVNHDVGCEINDLYSVWTGKAEPGIDWPICRNVSEGRICKEKMRFHLFMWFQLESPSPYLRFTPTHHLHTDKLKAIFSENGRTIRGCK